MPTLPSEADWRILEEERPPHPGEVWRHYPRRDNLEEWSEWKIKKVELDPPVTPTGGGKVRAVGVVVDCAHDSLFRRGEERGITVGQIGSKGWVRQVSDLEKRRVWR